MDIVEDRERYAALIERLSTATEMLVAERRWMRSAALTAAGLTALSAVFLTATLFVAGLWALYMIAFAAANLALLGINIALYRRRRRTEVMIADLKRDTAALNATRDRLRGQAGV